MGFISMLIFTIGLLGQLNLAHKCIHNEIIERKGKERLPPLVQVQDDGHSVSAQRNRLLQSTTDRPINIYLDYSNVDTNDDIQRAFISNVLSVELVRRLQSFVQVSGPTTIPKFTKTDCESMVKTPTIFSSQSTTADLILIIGTIQEDSNYVAYAAPCLYSSINSRPLVGVIMLNIKHLEVYKDMVDNFVATMLHEFMHVLVMSPDLFDSFPIGASNTYVMESRKTPAGFIKVYKLITPGLVSAGKKFFNCESFSGIYLENEGSDASKGSHFEKIMAGNEIMTAQATGRMVLSFWILNLLNDCGWYKIDFNQAENLTWGQNGGCDFLKPDCNTKYPEFCQTENKRSCSRDYRSKNICISTSFSDTCFINEYISNNNCEAGYVSIKNSPFESFGAKSRCFETLNNGKSAVGCYQASCVAGSLAITVSNITLSCTKTGDIVSKDSLKITCPDITDFCNQLNDQCAGDCGGRGKCVASKTCYCDFFNSGVDCTTPNTCGLSQNVCSAINILSINDSTSTTTTTTTTTDTTTSTNTDESIKGLSILSYSFIAAFALIA
jgi:hypothetical protein